MSNAAEPRAVTGDDVNAPREDYQRRLDALLGVTWEARGWMLHHRRVPPHMANTQRRLRLVKTVVGAVACFVLAVLSVVFGLVLASRDPASTALFAGIVAAFVLLIGMGLAIYGGIRYGRAFAEGHVEVLEGPLAAVVRRMHNTTPSYSVRVGNSREYRIERALSNMLVQGHPHRLYVLRRADIVLAIEG